MSSLAHCLKKLGLAEHEAAILKGRVQGLRDEGYEAHTAAVQAVKDRISELEDERADVVAQIEAQGGAVAPKEPRREDKPEPKPKDPKAPATPVDEAAHAAATSPENDKPEPTEAQKKAGNYEKGHVRIAGLDISIENPQGSERSGTSPDGTPWSVTMRDHYGYVKRTEGADGDHVDIFVRAGTPEDWTGAVYVVNQENEDGSFDEHKVMLGWDSGAAAREAYLANYTAGWESRIRSIAKFELDAFKAWLRDGDTTVPAVTPADPTKAALIPTRAGLMVQPLDAEGNPVGEPHRAGEKPASEPAPAAEAPREFEKGDRVVLGERYGGRHGEVAEKNVIVMRPVFGGGASERSVYYSVRTDNGATVGAVGAEEIQAETAKPENVIPDIEVSPGTWREPERVYQSIAQWQGSARAALAKAARAVKPENKAEHRATAARAEAEALKARTLWDAWAAKYPEEAAKIAPAAPAAAAPAAEATAPNASILAGKHSKTGEPIWTVVMSVRLGRDAYERVNARAKELGGYYSSFKGRGAVPGFIFKSKEKAEALMPAIRAEMQLPAPASPIAEEARTLTEAPTRAERIAEEARQLTPEQAPEPGATLDREEVPDAGTVALPQDGQDGAAAPGAPAARAPEGERGAGRVPDGESDGARADDGRRPGPAADDEQGPVAGELPRPDERAEAGGERGDGAGDRGSDRRDPGRNYRISDDDLTYEGGWLKKARQNLDAIRLVKQLEQAGRQATPEEQAVLVKYVGWGASELAQNIFPRYEYQARDEYRPLIAELKALLTPEEYDTARASTQYAHYTSKQVVRSIWHAMGRFGFRGGLVLEPGMGIGIFPGLMPDSVAGSSRYTGIEFDGITAAIAKQLFPRYDVKHADFIKQELPDNFYDVAIGNPPFSRNPILADPRYKKHGFLMHDYFFAKSLDRVRPGGLLVFVTSNGTMDKANDKGRRYLAERAVLLGAIRLPQTAFKRNAGTEVVTDVLFLQKKGEGVAEGQAWLGLAEVDTPKGRTTVNEYFAAHPEMVLGEHSLEGTMYKADSYTVLPREGEDIETAFRAAVDRLPADVFTTVRGSRAERAKSDFVDFDPKAQKDGQYYLTDKGDLLYRDAGVGRPAEVSAKAAAVLKDYVKLRDAVKQAQADQINDGDWAKSLKALNKVYDAFVKKHGHINQFRVTERKDKKTGEVFESKTFPMHRILRDDTEWTLIAALERVNEETGEIRKGDILLDRTLKRPAEPRIESVQDALNVVLDRVGDVDMDEIARLAGVTRAQAIELLGDAVYENPDGNRWETTDRYLSGNVRIKLRQARAAAKLDKRYARNVTALEKAQPADIPPGGITARLGAPWLEEQDIVQFFAETTNLRVTVRHNMQAGSWVVTSGGGEATTAATSEWGTGRRNAFQILDAALNSRTIRVTDTDRDGKTHFNATATQAAQEKLTKLQDAFGRWLWSDAERTDRLVKKYNEEYNNIATRSFNGDHLTLPGISSTIKLRPHQKRAVWRIIQSGNTYVAHAVGAGKTMEMVAAGMEMRRLGLIQKPVYAVPNHMLAQFSREFQQLYPASHIMVADEENFHTDNRRRFMARAAASNIDAIIVTHSALDLIDVRPEFKDKIIEEQLDLLRDALENTKKEERVARKQIERQIQALEQRLSGKLAGEGKDRNLTFEDMGADFLFVDEAHAFRKLEFATNRTSVKGISPGGSMRAMNLYIKVRYLESQRPGRTLVLASGTPVTNTMAELYTLQRFMQPAVLEERGLADFDAWAAMFGVESAAPESNAAGNYEMVTRFSKFVNLPELTQMFREFADVITSAELGNLVDRPTVRGGGRQMVVTPRVPELEDYQEQLKARIAAIRARKGKPKPGDDILLSVIGDGRFAAIDMRFIRPMLPSNPDSKLNKLIDGVIEVYQRTKDIEYRDEKGAPEPIRGGTQLIFSDIGFGEGVKEARGFDARAWMVKRLTEAGIPKGEIAFMSDYDSHAKKGQLFADMRAGRKKVLVGSSANMGTGVNVQKRLIAEHHLDSPWFPADMEQREGRIIRQGNQNPEVEIYAYATKGSYDTTMWQMLARKQRFIDQVMRGDPNVRSMDDLGEASQYEMAMALSSGDERIIRLAGLKADVERLERSYFAHQEDQRALRSKAESGEYWIKANQKKVSLLEKDKAQAKDISGERFTMKVGDAVYDKRTEGGAALVQAFSELAEALTETKGQKIGEAAGFDIVFFGEVKRNKKGEATDYFAVAYLKMAHADVTLVAAKDAEPVGATMRISNAVSGLQRDIDGLLAEVERYEREVKQAKSRIGIPFEFQQDLADKRAEVQEIEAALRAEGKDKEAADTPPIASSAFPASVRYDAAGAARAERLPKLDVQATTDTPEFRRWFGDSKVVDENGRPLVVYHGTGNAFVQFDPAKMDNDGRMIWASSSARQASSYAWSRSWKYLPGEFEELAENQGANVMPLYMAIENPVDLRGLFNASGKGMTGRELLRRTSLAKFATKEDRDVDHYDADWEAHALIGSAWFRQIAERAGHDGVVVRENGDVTYAAFRPEQVKSATGNRGTFDPQDPDIRLDLAEADDGATLSDDGGLEISKTEVDALRAGLSRWTVDKPFPEGSIFAAKLPADLSRLAAAFGIRVAGIGTTKDAPVVPNGVFFPPLNTLYLNVKADRPHMAVLGHEFLHYLRQNAPALYKELLEGIKPYVTRTGYQAFFEKMQRRGYGAARIDAAKSDYENLLAVNDEIREEFLAEVLSDAFMTPAFWETLGRHKPSLLGRVFALVRSLIERARAAFGGYQPRMQNYLSDFDRVVRIAAAVVAKYPGAQIAAEAEQLKLHAAWHGSPHDFEVFKLHAIGSGEGAQVFGWGLYFATRRGVAEWYRDTLAGSTKEQFTYDGKRVLPSSSDATERAQYELAFAKHFGGNARALAAALESVMAVRRSHLSAGHTVLAGFLDQVLDVLPTLEVAKAGYGKVAGGKLYRVELAPKVEDYLDWDKPIAEQSAKVRAGLEATGVMDVLRPHHSGERAYRELVWFAEENLIGETYPESMSGQEAASRELLAAGVPGIRYRDATSRAPAVRNFQPARPGTWNHYQDRYLYDTWVSGSMWIGHAKSTGIWYVNVNKQGPARNGPSANDLWVMSKQFGSLAQAQAFAEGFRPDEEEGTHNYVIFDDSLVTITAKFNAQDRRRTGLPAQAPVIASRKYDPAYKAHPDFAAAKAGDPEAALRFVRAMVDPATVERARQAFGEEVIFVAPTAEERAGRNAIPDTLAAYYAQALGGALDTNIVQASRAFHTGADAMERLVSRPTFAGRVIAGRRYVVVDDVTTSGSTLAELAHHIQSNGGVVVGAAVLADASRSGKMSPSPARIRDLERRFGDEIRSVLGIEPAALTHEEAEYLIGFRSTEELRNRAARAAQEVARRVSGQAVPRPQDGVAPSFDLPAPGEDGGAKLDAQEKKQPLQAAVGPMLGDLGLVSSLALHPRQIASLDRDFTPVYRVAEQQFQRRDELAADLAGRSAAYFDLNAEERQRVNAVLELDRLKGRVQLSGEKMTAKNEAHPLARLSKPGEEITLTAREKTAYWGVRHMLDAALVAFRDQVLTEWGFDPKAFKGKNVAAQIMALIDETMTPAEVERYEQAAKLVEDIEQARRTGYVPFTRWGNIAVRVQNQKGETLWVERIEAGARLADHPEVKRAVERLAKQFPDDRVTVFQVAEKQPADKAVTMLDLDALANVAKLDPAEWDAVRGQFEAALKTRGFRKHFIGAANVPGYSEDFERALADYIVGISGYLSRRQFNTDWDNAIGAIPAVKGRLREYADAYRAYANSPMEELYWLRQMGFFYYLAGVPASALVNLTQVDLLTAPYLMQFSNPAAVEAAILRARAEAVTMASTTQGFDVFDPDKAPADVREALKAAWAEGFFVPLNTYEVQGVAYNRTTLARGFTKGFNAVRDTVGLMFTAAERHNRLSTYIAAYRLAQSKGFEQKVRAILRANPLARAELLERFTPDRFARWVIDETHYRMGKVNRARVARGVGAALLQFKGFTMQTLELWYRLATQNGVQGKVALGVSLAGFMLLAGFWGLPGGDDLRDLIEKAYRTWFHRDLDLRTKLREAIAEATDSPRIAEMFSKGAPTALGVDLSGRIGMGNITPDSPLQVGGIPVDLFVGRPLRAMEQAGNQRPELAVGALLPKFMENIIQGWSWSEYGIRNRKGQVVIPPENVAKGEAAMKMAGFQPARIANKREAEFAKSRAERSVSELRDDFYARVAFARAEIYRARQAEDRKRLIRAEAALLKVTTELAEYNRGREAHEQIRLDQNAINRRVREEILGAESQRGKRAVRGRREEIDSAYGVSR